MDNSIVIRSMTIVLSSGLFLLPFAFGAEWRTSNPDHHCTSKCQIGQRYDQEEVALVIIMIVVVVVVVVVVMTLVVVVK